MFIDRVYEILSAIDYELYSLNDKALIVIDKKDKGNKRILDYLELPCSELSLNKDRKIECVNDDNTNYIGVRYTNIDGEGYTSFLEIKSKKDQYNDYLSCEFENNGKFNSITLGNNMCKFREMDLVEGIPMVTELNFDENEINVSRQLKGNSEGIRLFKNGLLTFYKNGEMVETVQLEDDIDKYFSSVVSTVDPIIEGSISCLSKVNPDLVKLMAKEFPLLKELFKHGSECYETDFIDNYLRKHDLFIHDESITNVK